MLTADAILESVIVDPATQTGPAHDRAAARDLKRVIGWGLTAEERETVKAALMQAVSVGRLLSDGTYRKPGPRTLTMLAKCLAELHRQDLDDLHHLEGERHRVEHIDGRPLALQAAELLLKAAAATGRSDLKARAQAMIAGGEGDGAGEATAKRLHLPVPSSAHLPSKATTMPQDASARAGEGQEGVAGADAAGAGGGPSPAGVPKSNNQK